MYIKGSKCLDQSLMNDTHIFHNAFDTHEIILASLIFFFEIYLTWFTFFWNTKVRNQYFYSCINK